MCVINFFADTHAGARSQDRHERRGKELYFIGGRVLVAQPGSRSEMVNTLDFESKDPSSNLGGTFQPFGLGFEDH